MGKNACLLTGSAKRARLYILRNRWASIYTHCFSALVTDVYGEEEEEEKKEEEEEKKEKAKREREERDTGRRRKL